MQFVDLNTQYRRIEDDIKRRIHAVLEHGQYVMGPEVSELEQKLADYVGVKHCIGVSSGTDGLLVAMMALDIGPGDEVITTAFSFFATAEMIVLLGAKPVFVDIDPRTYNLDVNRLEAAISDNTKAIVPVSLYGQCADFDAINALAKRYGGIAVFEDAAQSFGATYKGRQSCALSTIGVTSFFPSKPLGAYGDGGACFTDDDELAARMAQLRNHGQASRYHHTRIGINGRLDTLQAAVLLAKLEIFPAEVEARARLGERYGGLLRQATNTIEPPFIEPHNSSVYAQYTVAVDDRERLQQKLAGRAIPTAVHYPAPMNIQPALAKLGHDRQRFGVAERAGARVLSLPLHPYLTAAEQENIIACLVD